MKVVLGYLKPYTGRVAVGVTIKFTAAILELVLPLLLATNQLFHKKTHSGTRINAEDADFINPRKL